MSEAGGTGRLRVAVLNRVFSAGGGGAESYSIRLVEQLAARHEIHVFAQEIQHEWPGVTYHRVSCPLRKRGWINQIWYAAATWLATRHGFDVVHSHENTWHGLVQTIHVKPVRLNLLGGVSGWRRGLRWLKICTSARLAAYLWLEAARFRPRPGRQVVLTSTSLQADALAAYPRAAAAMAIVTPGVAMPAGEWNRALARRALQLPPRGPLLLFVANDYARKGLTTLLAALVTLPPDLRLAVVGNTGQVQRFRDVALALGVGERVHFLGSLDGVEQAYRAADVLVHPTLDDTFAMVVLEGLAHGLPVVVSGPAQCGISTLLKDGKDALLLTDPRDSKELVGTLQRLLDDPALQRRLAANGREFALAHTWKRAADEYERLYRRSVEAAGP
ncbi:MAG: glycosyl transferase, group 1 [Ramlibacter sp.]|jgi:glycosyltransferase involved in cell wall biosynthesis|nr:glycosyl transferase, group 1 [Ramlibacter sp.]